MTSLGSLNWKLSVHRQDSSHGITSVHWKRVKKAWLAREHLKRPCARKYYTHQQSSLSDELTLSNLPFTLPAKIFSIQVHKPPMAGDTPSPLLLSDTFLFQNSHCVVQFTPRHACQARLTWASLSMCKTVHMDDCWAALVSGSERGWRGRKCAFFSNMSVFSFALKRSRKQKQAQKQKGFGFRLCNQPQ